LKEKVGYPYTTLSDDMFHHAAGGYAGQGTLCGSIGACSSIINLVAKDENKTHNKMIADLINWYASYNHPTDEFDSIVKFPKQIRVAPGSPLCHVSVSTWTMAADTEIATYERKDRCAKVAGRVAMQTVMMLNDYADGKFKPSAPDVSEKTASCLDCHGPDEDHNQQGRMECGLCHAHTADHAE
jgi:hypothetical protein